MVLYEWHGDNRGGLAVIWTVSQCPSSLLPNRLTRRGHVKNPHLHGWQAIYLVVGLLTVISVPIIYVVVDSNPATARFFDERDRAMAIERLRANQTGTGNTHFKWRQALEMFYDTKSWLFFGMSFLLNVGAQVTNAFGPTLIATFGFDSYVSLLLRSEIGC